MRFLLTMLLAGTLAASAAALPAPAVAQTRDLARGRQEVAQLDARRADVSVKRAGLEAELDRVATEIAQLKSDRSTGVSFSDAKLDRNLKRSLELSAQVDRLAREEAQVRTRLQRAAARLLKSYQREVAAARIRLKKADGQDDQERAVQSLIRLEAERREVAAGIERLASPQRTVLVEAGGDDSDDPDELRARADRLRDTQDKLVRRLKLLDRRMAELQEQAELQDEMSAFLDENDLFGDQARAPVTISTQARGKLDTAAGATDISAESAAPAPDAPVAAGFDDSDGALVGDIDPDADFAEQRFELDTQASFSAATAADSIDTEAIFQLDRLNTRVEDYDDIADLLRVQDAGSVGELQARKAQINALIERLDRRADRLEHRAKDLDR